MRILIIVFLILSFNLIQAQDRTEIKIINVEPYMALSYQAFFKDLTLKTDDCCAEFIEGFDFEWGYSYCLKVQITYLAQPPEDASDRTYKLIKVKSKTRVTDDYEFTMRIEDDLYLGPGDQETTMVDLGGNKFRYFGQINVVYKDDHLPQLNKIRENKKSLMGTFTFGKDGEINLQALK